MINILIKSLFFYLIILSVIGYATLFITNKRASIYISITILFFFSWRPFFSNISSRYYSFLIFPAVFLAAYAIDFICRSQITPPQKRILICFLLFFLLSCHLIKDFSGFRDNYIFNIYDSFSALSSNNTKRNTQTYICEKEFNRLNRHNDDNFHLLMNSFLSPDMLTDNYIKTCSFGNVVYYIFQESNISHNSANGAAIPHLKKIQSHLTNSKHDKILSVYKHFPYTPKPDIELDSLFHETLTLKAYLEKYDTYVYNFSNKLLWIIGSELHNDTIIIYHIHTNQPDLLPENRRRYSFDNRDFMGGGPYEKESIGKYRVFIRDIPSEYPVTYFRVGFDNKGVVDVQHFAL